MVDVIKSGNEKKVKNQNGKKNETQGENGNEKKAKNQNKNNGKKNETQGENGNEKKAKNENKNNGKKNKNDNKTENQIDNKKSCCCMKRTTEIEGSTESLKESNSGSEKGDKDKDSKVGSKANLEINAENFKKFSKIVVEIKLKSSADDLVKKKKKDKKKKPKKIAETPTVKKIEVKSTDNTEMWLTAIQELQKKKLADKKFSQQKKCGVSKLIKENLDKCKAGEEIVDLNNWKSSKTTCKSSDNMKKLSFGEECGMEQKKQSKMMLDYLDLEEEEYEMNEEEENEIAIAAKSKIEEVQRRIEEILTQVDAIEKSEEEIGDSVRINLIETIADIIRTLRELRGYGEEAGEEEEPFIRSTNSILKMQNDKLNTIVSMIQELKAQVNYNTRMQNELKLSEELGNKSSRDLRKRDSSKTKLKNGVKCESTGVQTTEEKDCGYYCAACGNFSCLCEKGR